MRHNVGGIDRLARFTIAAILIILNLSGVLSGPGAIVAWIVAGVALITAMLRFCPATALFGINTCRT